MQLEIQIPESECGSYVEHGMHRKSRSGKYSWSFLQFQLSTREPEIFPGAPLGLLPAMELFPAWKHQGDAVDVPPAGCVFRGKKSRKRTKLEKPE